MTRKRRDYKIIKAKGTRGELLHGGDGIYFLRVQRPDHPEGFVDYILEHEDCTIEITDDLVCFYEPLDPEKEPVLDEGPDVLGLGE